jgi:hypothetical protein
VTVLDDHRDVHVGPVVPSRLPRAEASAAVVSLAARLGQTPGVAAMVGVLCQLEATVPVRPLLRRWLPGFSA